jgi:protein phosphatase
MNITIPKLSLVLLIGPSGSGKSSFAQEHFLATEVLNSDTCRGWVADDENDQLVTKEAFEVLHFITRKRLAAGKLTVIDATNVQSESRKPLLQIAREYHCIPVAIIFNLSEKICQQRNEDRPDRDFGPHVIRQQRSQMRRGLRGLRREGFRHTNFLESEQQVNEATITRQPLWNDKREVHGPFDIIGDVHGCGDELEELLVHLGYKAQKMENSDPVWGDLTYAHPEDRQVIFLGDLVDRGPRILDCLRMARNMVVSGSALCVPGNHDAKLKRKLWGKNVKVAHGLAESVAEVEGLPEDIRDEFSQQAADFLDSLVSHYVLDDGKLVVAHAGMKESMQGRGSGAVREFALYGETTGETDEFGLPIRYNWAAEYRGHAHVVYGHTPVPYADWLNRTVNIDTGCVFGGALTALRYPEKEFVQVKAKQIWSQPARKFLPEDQFAPQLSAQQLHDDVLDIDDVIGKCHITTRLQTTVTIREANATAALEVMSRFAANPRWLIYLPPTMSPCETSERDGFLEHPDEAFSYYRNNGVPQVICEEKHMGSRAVVIVCRDEEAARARFGVADEGCGMVFTRTGRRFFDQTDLEQSLLEQVSRALCTTGFWETFRTDWVCLDCELMPWSAKAQELLRSQYAAVGAAARAALPETIATLKQTIERKNQLTPGAIAVDSSAGAIDLDSILECYEHRSEHIEKYVAAYQHYCWPVESLNDLKLAPFHILATEGMVHIDKDHLWHMDELAKICGEDSQILLATPYKIIDVTDPVRLDEGVRWWLDLTDKGGEGMVVKPLDFVARGKRGLVQPAVKCRGREYLRIIYGPEYTCPEHLERLRERGLAHKRSLAMREFALGIEALERFIAREPLRRTHECVFGVLAMESEPVDPRL